MKPIMDYIYQEHDKSYVAGFLGLPVGTFYHWSYKRWAKVRTKFDAFKDEAWAWWCDTGKFKNSKDVLMGDIWKRYKVVYKKKHSMSLNKKLGVKEK